MFHAQVSRNEDLFNRKTRLGTHCGPYASTSRHVWRFSIVLLSLFLCKMHNNILRRPVPRTQEDKASGIDAHFECILRRIGYMLFFLKAPGFLPGEGFGGPHVARGRTTTKQTPTLRPGGAERTAKIYSCTMFLAGLLQSNEKGHVCLSFLASRLL